MEVSPDMGISPDTGDPSPDQNRDLSDLSDLRDLRDLRDLDPDREAKSHLLTNRNLIQPSFTKRQVFKACLFFICPESNQADTT